jgi:hypothetical protein
MKTQLDNRKPCYRCGNMVPVPLAAAPYAERFACCEPCRVKLDIEAGFAGAIPLPKDEAPQPQAPASPAIPT